MLKEEDALNFVSTALEYDALSQRMQEFLRRGDLPGLVKMAHATGFNTDVYQLVLALELQILRALQREQLTPADVENLFGGKNWALILHNWQMAYPETAV